MSVQDQSDTKREPAGRPSCTGGAGSAITTGNTNATSRISRAVSTGLSIGVVKIASTRRTNITARTGTTDSTSYAGGADCTRSVSDTSTTVNTKGAARTDLGI